MKGQLLLPLIVSLAGCWKFYEEAELISYDEVPLINEHSDGSDGVMVRMFTPDPELACPDGEPASFYAVYDPSITDSVPVGILFHSGAFDYVKSPSQSDYLSGGHYATDDRLSWSWAQTRVYTTLGMWESSVQSGLGTGMENHTGALPVALAQHGVMTLIPSNCWGDLWHGFAGRQENDYTTERFYRNGLALASWMYRIVTDETFAEDHGVVLPLQPDTSQISLLGLADGGRAVSELLWLLDESSYGTVPINAVFLDSTPDVLSTYIENESQYYNVVTGLERIFDERIEDIEHYSLDAYLVDALGGGSAASVDSDDPQDSEPPKLPVDTSDTAKPPKLPGPLPTYLPSRIMVVWSSYDNNIQSATLEDMVATVETLQDDDPEGALVYEESSAGHVFSNQGMALADDVADFLYGDN